MKKYFSVGEAAKIVHTTSETLRHYDRIGLVKPSKKDEWTNYRYYTEQDIVRLNTVRALQQMDLPLQEIKRVLEYDDLQKILDFLTQAEKKADEKMAALQYSKSKIQLAKADYEKKLQAQQKQKELEGAFLKEYPERVILLSDRFIILKKLCDTMTQSYRQESSWRTRHTAPQLLLSCRIKIFNYQGAKMSESGNRKGIFPSSS